MAETGGQGADGARLHSTLKMEGIHRDHRTAGVGRKLWRWSPTSLPEKVPYSVSHSSASSMVGNICTEGDCPTSLGSLFLCSVTLTGKLFLMFVRNFRCSSFPCCPLFYCCKAVKRACPPPSSAALRGSGSPATSAGVNVCDFL